MNDEIKTLIIGSYSFQLPVSWQFSVEATPFDDNIPNQSINTFWKINTGRFFFRIQLKVGDLDDLARFIERTTRENVLTRKVNVDGLQGVTYGGFEKPRTWVDWYFKCDSLMICINLQSNVFPHTEPLQSEVNDIQTFISSIEHSPSAGY